MHLENNSCIVRCEFAVTIYFILILILISNFSPVSPKSVARIIYRVTVNRLP